MIILEDSKSYELRRMQEECDRQRKLILRGNQQIHPQMQHLLDIIQEADKPIRFVEVANRFAKEVAHHWDNRQTKAKLRLLAFQLLGQMVRQFLIARHKRKWVVYLGPDNPRRKAWFQEGDDTIRNLPKPNV